MFHFSKISAFLLFCNIGLSSALFENCNHSYYNSDPNRLYVLNSPHYPNKYDASTSCLYMITVPQDYEIVADCTLSLPKGETSCTTDFFFISRDSDQTLNGAEQICGTGNLTRTSLFNKIAIAFASTANSTGGWFTCKLTTRPQACDCGWSSQTKIVGGSPATQYEYPSVVSLQLKSTRQHVCGGTIINHRYIVTAAHCTLYFEKPQNIQIYAGYYEQNETSQFTRIYEAQEFINYPGYNWLTNANDIALIKTELSIEWSRFIGPICLPIDQVFNHLEDYINVNVVGWGTIFFAGPVSKTLQTAEVYVVPNSNCVLFRPSVLCTFYTGRDACQRDSGGPVVLKGSVREYLVGIISEGNACAGRPAINTRTTSYLEWIYQTTNRSLCYKPYNR